MELNNLKKSPFNLSDEDISWVVQTRNNMNLEEKIGQIFCLIFKEGSDEELADELNVMKFGGAMFRPIMDAKTAARFIEKINKNLTVPALIAANLERGGEGVMKNGTYFASQLEVAATQDVEMVRKLARVCGEEASAIGANWAFSPIIDVDMNWRNPITNTRTFGSNPKLVREFGREFVTTIQDLGLAACIKHFPGDGVDERDQHLVTSVNSLSVEEWDKTFGKAYKESIDAGALTCMVGHIMLPEYQRKLNPNLKDDEILPASLSKELLNDLLRDKLGFNGLIVTDATTMAGFTLPMPRSLAVPSAIAAGADMFLFTRNLKEDYNFMLEGAKNGIITSERLDDAVTRVLATKAALGLHKNKFVIDDELIDRTVGSKEHIDWSLECADKAITLVKQQEGVLPLTKEKYKKILLFPIQPAAGGSGQYQVKAGVIESIVERLKKEGFDVDVFSPNTGSKEGQCPAYMDMTSKYDLMIYVGNMKTKSNQTVVRIEWAQPMGADCMHYLNTVPTIFISLENPYHLIDVPRVKTYINTYSSNDQCIVLLIEKLMGRSKFKGTNPIDPFCGKWDTRL